RVTPTLFPYTTLFRSPEANGRSADQNHTPPGHRRLSPATLEWDGYVGMRWRDSGPREAYAPAQRATRGRLLVRCECMGLSVRCGDRKSTRLNSSHVKI